MSDFVFGYASLVGFDEPAALPGRLNGFRRFWGAAMDNWDAVNDPKHFVDPETGERPRIRVAYLDIYEQEGSSVNGLALPVDEARLAALDEREVNYERVDVSGAFEASGGERNDRHGAVFTYTGTEAARERCRAGIAESNICVSAGYVAALRSAFERLGTGALDEFDRTTDSLTLPERDLERIWR